VLQNRKNTTHSSAPVGTARAGYRSERGYCASVERGAGSRDFESWEQELLSEFYKYRNSTKNRNFDGQFFQKFYFW
jgi:hypothetical protein